MGHPTTPGWYTLALFGSLGRFAPRFFIFSFVLGFFLQGLQAPHLGDPVPGGVGVCQTPFPGASKHPVLLAIPILNKQNGFSPSILVVGD